MNRFRGVVFALGLIAIALSLRAPFLGRDIWNLDEASTFTMAQQILEGGVLFRDAADNRSPLVPYLKAAVFAVAGDWNAFAVHLLVAFGLGLAAVAIWRIATRLGDEPAGIWAAVFFTIVSFLMLEPVDALTAHTGWFLIFFSISGFWVFARAISRPTFGVGVAIGALFGLSTLCKQPGILDFGVTFVLVGLLALESPDRARNFARLLAGQLFGFASALVLTVSYFAAHGALADMFFYAWSYNIRYYVPEVPFLERMAMVRMPFEFAWKYIPVALFAGVLGAVGLIGRAFAGLKKPVRIHLLAWLILGWTAAGLLSTMLSGRQFSHYNIQVLPGLSLACGWFAARAVVYFRSAGQQSGRCMRVAGAVLVIISIASAGLNLRKWQSRVNPIDDFSKGISEVVARHTVKSDPILVWGYYPEYYFFSKRLPSTRFIYMNFLTGLIPWTNVDPLIDTSYASIPGGWDQFWSDFDRKPPAVIIDTGGARGYFKYPLYKQGRLWTTVISNYAVVEESATTAHGVRVYRQLAVVEPNETAPEGTLSEAVQIEDSTIRGSQPKIIAITIRAPAGAASVELLRGDFVFKRVDYLLDVPCEVTMLVYQADLEAESVLFRGAVHTKDGVLLSRALDVAAYSRKVQNVFAAGPPISFGSAKIQPTEGEAAHGPMMQIETQPGFWHAHAPSRLEYARDPAMHALIFGYGVEEAAYDNRHQGITDGYTASLSISFPDGGSEVLYQRNLDPANRPEDRGPQTVRVVLPEKNFDRFVLRLDPGPSDNTVFDWTYFTTVRGQGFGPDIELEGGGRLVPFEGEALERERIRLDITIGRWGAHAPSRLAYRIPPGLAAVSFGFSLDERVYANDQGGMMSDGFDVLVFLEDDGAKPVEIFRRRLNPHYILTDRGPQVARVELPPGASGNLVFVMGPGPKGNNSFDWSYWFDFRGRIAP